MHSKCKGIRETKEFDMAKLNCLSVLLFANCVAIVDFARLGSYFRLCVSLMENHFHKLNYQHL